MSLESVRDVVDAVGGLRRAAALTRVQPDTVSAWQTRLGKFPSNTYLVLTAELQRRGHRRLPSPSLWAMKEHPGRAVRRSN